MVTKVWSAYSCLLDGTADDIDQDGRTNPWFCPETGSSSRGVHFFRGFVPFASNMVPGGEEGEILSVSWPLAPVLTHPHSRQQVVRTMSSVVTGECNRTKVDRYVQQDYRSALPPGIRSLNDAAPKMLPLFRPVPLNTQ